MKLNSLMVYLLQTIPAFNSIQIFLKKVTDFIWPQILLITRINTGKKSVKSAKSAAKNNLNSIQIIAAASHSFQQEQSIRKDRQCVVFSYR